MLGQKSSGAFMLFSLLIISIIWTIFSFAALYSFSQIISLIGVYHPLNSENIYQKLWQIGKCNGVLSLPLIFAINLLLQTTLSNLDARSGFFLSLPITASLLMIIRILANPSMCLKPSHCLYFADKKDKLDTVALHKERVLSFVYAFIISAIIILLLLFCYSVLMNLPFDRLKMPPLSSFEIAESFVAYLFSLACATLAGELILKIKPPIIQVPPRTPGRTG
jgi:hypothetical protein